MYVFYVYAKSGFELKRRNMIKTRSLIRFEIIFEHVFGVNWFPPEQFESK